MIFVIKISCSILKKWFNFVLFRLEDENMKKIMDERKREKQEEKVARDRVKAQIEADKLARKKLYGQASAEEQPKKVLPVAVSPQKQTKDYTETKLQVKMLNTHIEFYILIIIYYIQCTIHQKMFYKKNIYYYLKYVFELHLSKKLGHVY